MSFRSWRERAHAQPLCVGIDPHAAELAAWGLPDTAEGVLEFSRTLLDAAAGHAAFVKPQSAFFERHGHAGIAALEDVLAGARERGLLTILDAKRGDIGSTMAGYASAYLEPGRPLAADALTVSPYLGVGALRPAMELAAEHGRGLFVLALTSNPEGAEVQHAQTAAGHAVARRVVEECEAFNAELDVPLIGLVVGATIGTAAADLGIDLGAFTGPILAPGFGSQGAGSEELAEVFGAGFGAGRVIVNASRSISRVGPEKTMISGAIAAVNSTLSTFNS